MDSTRAFESVPQDGGAFESGFLLVFVVVGALVLAGFVFVGYAMVRSARAAKRAGLDPFTPESVLIADALRGRGGRSVEQRLAELDDLHARGVISSEEHVAARRKALEA